MAKTIILARHGQTSANQRQIIQRTSGQISLNEFGRGQVHRLASFLINTFSSLKVWHAPQKRVLDATHIIASHSSLIEEVVELDELSQRNWGSSTGQRYNVRSGEMAYIGEPGSPLAYDAETLLSTEDRLRFVVKMILRDSSLNHVVLGSNEVLNYLSDILHGQPFKKSTFTWRGYGAGIRRYE